MSSKDKWNIGIPLFIVSLYICIIFIIHYCSHKLEIGLSDGDVKMPLWLGLLIIWILELFNTIAFQFRMWLTSKDRIQEAAIVGSLNW